MQDRPPFFTQSSIRSRDMSDPQAYRLSYHDDGARPGGMPAVVERGIPRATKRASVMPDPSPAKAKGASYKPGFWLYMAFATLGILTVMVALDATALSVALPVSADAFFFLWMWVSFAVGEGEVMLMWLFL